MQMQNTTLDDVSAVIGFSATLRLSAWFGDGGNVYVPAAAEVDEVLEPVAPVRQGRRLDLASLLGHVSPF